MDQLYTLLFIAGLLRLTCVYTKGLQVETFPVLAVVEGDDAVLKCTATRNNGTLIEPSCQGDVTEFEWFMENSLIATCKTILANYSMSLDGQTGTLTISNVAMSLNGTRFNCQVGLRLGGFYESNHTTLFVHKRNFSVSTSQLVNAIRWQDVTLHCSVIVKRSSHDQDFTFKWLLGNTSLSDACKNNETSKVGEYVFHHDNRSCNLTIRHLDLSDEGIYRCEVHDSFHIQWNPSYLSVQVPPEVVFIIYTSTGDILQGDVYLPVNISHNFTCFATKTKPPAEITWTFRGEAVSSRGDEVSSAGKDGLANVSNAVSVMLLQSMHEELTCKAEGPGAIVSSTIRLIQSGDERTDPKTDSAPGTASTVKTADTAEKDGFNLIVILIPLATSLLLVIFILVVTVWKRRKDGHPVNTALATVRFRRASIDRPTASVSPVVGPVLNVIIGSGSEGSTNIYEEGTNLMVSSSHGPTTTPPSILGIRNCAAEPSPSHRENMSDGSGSSNDQHAAKSQEKVMIGSTEELVYADLHHTTAHPANSAPIRTEPPTQYADVQQYLLPIGTPPQFSDDWDYGKGGGTNTIEGEADEEVDEEAPPLPRRDSPITLSANDWVL